MRGPSGLRKFSSVQLRLERGLPNLGKNSVMGTAQTSLRGADEHFGFCAGEDDDVFGLCGRGPAPNSSKSVGELRAARQPLTATEVKRVVFRCRHPKEVNLPKRSIFQAAASGDDEQLLSLVLSCQADVNDHEVSSGRAPLHYALRGGQERTAELLILLGARKSAVDFFGQTSVHYVAEACQHQLLDVLFHTYQDHELTAYVATIRNTIRAEDGDLSSAEGQHPGEEESSALEDRPSALEDGPDLGAVGGSRPEDGENSTAPSSLHEAPAVLLGRGVSHSHAASEAALAYFRQSKLIRSSMSIIYDALTFPDGVDLVELICRKSHAGDLPLHLAAYHHDVPACLVLLKWMTVYYQRKVHGQSSAQLLHNNHGLRPSDVARQRGHVVLAKYLDELERDHADADAGITYAAHTLALMPYSDPTCTYPRRFPVPTEKIDWDTPFEGYEPTAFTSGTVLKNGSDAVVGGWADPDDPAIISKVALAAAIICKDASQPLIISKDASQRYSYHGLITFYDPNVMCRGWPRNPMGRTGMVERGALGNWGPNLCSDPIITRRRGPLPESPLQVLVIRRFQDDQGGFLWSLPGSFGTDFQKLRDIFKEFRSSHVATYDKLQFDAEVEEMLGERHGEPRERRTFENGTIIFSGYVDDARNTDNAWIETEAVHFACRQDGLIARIPNGDETLMNARSASWIDADELIGAPSSHQRLRKARLGLHKGHLKWVQEVRMNACIG